MTLCRLESWDVDADGVPQLWTERKALPGIGTH